MAFKFLSLFLAPCLLITVLAQSESDNLLQDALKKPRQRSGTRNWFNALQGGFLEGSMKYISQGKMDCSDEGMKLLRALYTLGSRDDEHTSDDDRRNYFMLASDIFRRCNYMATLEGVVMSKVIREGINSYIGSDIGVWFGWTIVLIEVMVNGLDDFLIVYLA